MTQTGQSREAVLDRAMGAVVVSACGDALGSQYEFGNPLDADATPEFGVGYFGHGLGEWTDDTSMAMPVFLALTRGESISDEAALVRIVSEWRAWAKNALDVGNQTRRVLRSLPEDFTEDNARAISQRTFETHTSEGNGSLMRTGPVALGYLGEGDAPALAEAARRVSELTHWGENATEACVLWCLAIRHGILTGELDAAVGLAFLEQDRREIWQQRLDEAVAAEPSEFAADNGWVVAALQGALSAVSSASGPVEAVERAVRGGGDTDTVAAIAGSLAGTVWGVSGVPDTWRDLVHGWPELTARDLERLVPEIPGVGTR